MGMFDYVDAPERPCRKCGDPVGGWQSKDGPCELKHLDVSAVNFFYTVCDHCGAWNEYRRRFQSVRGIEDFDEIGADSEAHDDLLYAESEACRVVAFALHGAAQ